MASSLSGLLKAAADQSDPRARDAAFAELLRLVGIYVRAGMGRGLRGRRESMDVCQSVAKSFVDDMTAGKLMFESEAAVAGYLQKVVKSKLAELAREDNAKKRAAGTPIASLTESVAVSDADQSAVFDRAGAGEQWDKAIAFLTPEEQLLVSLRRRGLEWEIIANQLGREPSALRQQFSRLQQRVIDRLGEHEHSGDGPGSSSASAGSV